MGHEPPQTFFGVVQAGAPAFEVEVVAVSKPWELLPDHCMAKEVVPCLEIKRKMLRDHAK